MVNLVLSGIAIACGRVRLWLFSDLVLAAALFGSAYWLVLIDHEAGLAIAYLLGYLATCAVLIPTVVKLFRRKAWVGEGAASRVA